jgi:hypothetical protein
MLAVSICLFKYILPQTRILEAHSKSVRKLNSAELYRIRNKIIKYS